MNNNNGNNDDNNKHQAYGAQISIGFMIVLIASPITPIKFSLVVFLSTMQPRVIYIFSFNLMRALFRFKLSQIAHTLFSSSLTVLHSVCC